MGVVGIGDDVCPFCKEGVEVEFRRHGLFLGVNAYDVPLVARTAGHDVVATREPGGTRIGEKIRELLRSGSKDDVFSPRTELMLFEASRAQHMEEIILPALNNGKIVLCDRFFDSTTVYQGVARAIDTDIVHILNDFSSFERKPDLTIILDIDVDESMNRLIKREISKDRIEQEDRKFFENVRNGYLSLAQNNERFFVVDGTSDANSIQQKIRDELSKRFFVR